MISAEFNPFKLGWSHYQILMRIKDENARKFYEIESIEQQWKVEELKRNYQCFITACYSLRHYR